MGVSGRDGDVPDLVVELSALVELVEKLADLRVVSGLEHLLGGRGRGLEEVD